MDLFNYLLKASACSVLFFAFYLLVLKKLTFFKLNRFYLLATLILSFLIPALNITVERQVAQALPIAEEVATFDQTPQTQTEDITNTVTQLQTSPVAPSFDWFSLLPYFYAGIVLILVGIGLWQLISLLWHVRSNQKTTYGLKLVVKRSGFTNCSFFNYVFVDQERLTEQELAVLLRHEQVHAQQYHSIDKIIMMFAKAVMWFNPVVYLWNKALEQVHEFEADEATSAHFGSKEYASLLLRLAVSKSNTPLIHNFVKSPIKERVKMLFNSKSKNMKKLMYMLVVPIVLGLIWGFTVKVVEVFPSETEQNDFVLVLDAGHGGKQKGAEINGVTEKELTLAIAQKINAIAQSKGIKVVMTRSSDEDVSFKERLAKNGDVLISLHVNSEPNTVDGKRNGIEMYTPIMDGTLKNPMANSVTHYIFERLKKVEGIGIKNNPIQKNLMLLRESKSPAIALEMGYITNTSDFNFITNAGNQDKLATGIVDGVISYRNSIKDKSFWKVSNGNKDELWGKTIKGKVKAIVLTDVGETLNFAYEKGVVRVFNPIKGKINVGDELTMKVGGTIHNIVVSDAKGNVIKELDAPCITADIIKSSTGKVLYELKNEQKPFISKTSVLKRNDYREERITLNTYSGKILATKVGFMGKTNKSVKVYISVNGKLYNEHESLKFDKNFISKLSTNRGFSFANDFDIPEIKDKNLAVVFWFGQEPKLSFEKARRRQTAKTYNEKAISGKIVDITYNENKLMNGFIVKTAKETVKANVEAKFATQIRKMVEVGDEVSIKVYIADYWRQMNMPILISYKLMKDGKLLFDRWPKQPVQALAVNGYDEMPQSKNFTQQSVEKARGILVSGPGKEGNLELSKDVSIAKMRYQASDSVRVNKIFESMLLSGKAELDMEKYRAKGRVIHLDNTNQMVTVYLGYVQDENNLKIEAEVIEIDLKNNRYFTKNYSK